MKKMKLRIKAILEIEAAIENIKLVDTMMLNRQPDEWKGVSRHLMYTLGKVKSKIRHVVDAVKEMRGEPPEALLRSFANDRLVLLRAHAKQTEKGEPMTSPDGARFIIADLGAFEKALEELKVSEKYKSHFDREKEIEKAVKEKEKQEEEIELPTIRLDQLPDQMPGLSTIMEALEPIIEDPGEKMAA